MACGVPFCQSGMMIGGMASGCPLHNLVPETNDLVYTGNWKQAFLRLSKTHSFPEFTSRVCPALCEAACTCNINGEPVSTKENERAIIETAYENGWVTPQIPEVRTGKSIAVIGSGPSGLAAAQQLNRRGHSVTVFERKDRVGGLLRYGIPNMKLDKAVVDRRIHLMEEEGVKFVTNVNVGKDIKAEELLKQFDRVILACGASNPRDIKVPGRDVSAHCHKLAAGHRTCQRPQAHVGHIRLMRILPFAKQPGNCGGERFQMAIHTGIAIWVGDVQCISKT